MLDKPWKVKEVKEHYFTRTKEMNEDNEWFEWHEIKIGFDSKGVFIKEKRRLHKQMERGLEMYEYVHGRLR